MGGSLSLDDRKSTGSHYTPSILADFVAREILEAWSFMPVPERLRVLDPAVGDGELLLAMLEGLSERGHFNVEVFGFDTDQNAAQLASSRIKRAFPQVALDLMHEDFLEFALKFKNPGLFERLAFEPVDLIIANPPYVRTQVMGATRAQRLSKQFGLSGRVDLYYAFIRGMAWVLRPGGVGGIIVSNRFMKTQSGASVRKSILEDFDILHVWDLGDTRLFEAAVLPAVLLVRRKTAEPRPTRSRFTSIYSTKCSPSARLCSDAIAALKEDGLVKLGTGHCYSVQHGKLHHGKLATGVWRLATRVSEEWLNTVGTHTYCTFGEIGKVRVGVKTTADKVFIRNDWLELPEGDRPELLRPLTTHHVAKRYKAIEPAIPWKILYTHQVVEGKRVAVNLDEYPISARYLNRHRSVLERREYVKKAGRNWFEIWVPQDPDAWRQPKIVFRDIAQKPTFWMDLSGSVVNGDCYWLSCHEPERMDSLWLALGVANSSFIEAFYDRRFNNKLYSGRRRFITQYVKHFPLPNPETEQSRQIIHLAEKIYDLTPSPEANDLEEQLDHRVWEVFGLQVEEVPG